MESAMRHRTTMHLGCLLAAVVGAILPIGCETQPSNKAAPVAVKVEPTTLPSLAPTGYNRATPEAPKGKLETISYPSKTVGVNRPAVVYTPPGYDAKQKYPVMYLLHGINSDENQWSRGGGATNIIMDNLYAAKKAVPMIIVMPNGNAVPNPAQATGFTNTQGYTIFEKDLLQDLIPYIEANFAAKTDRQNRALAGLSMGGGQTLHFGLLHPEAFAWVGGFSSAPNTPSGALLDSIVANLKTSKDKHDLIWIGCGVSDNLITNGVRVKAALDAANIKNVEYLQAGVHDFNVWNNNLYLFAQMLFKPVGSVIPPVSPATMPANLPAGRGGPPGGGRGRGAPGGAPGGRGAPGGGAPGGPPPTP
jgi:enterochelin esterase-like enzyme